MTRGGDGYSQPTNYVMKTALCELFRPTRLLALSCAAWLMGAGFSVRAAEPAPSQSPAPVPVPVAAASVTNDALKAALRDVQEISSQMVRLTHDLQYADPALKALREEIGKLELEVSAKRKALEQKMAQFPEMVKLEKARREAFDRLQKARGSAGGRAAGG